MSALRRAISDSGSLLRFSCAAVLRKTENVPRVMQDFMSSEPLAPLVKSPPASFLLGGRTNIVEQDHRAIKRRIKASLGFRSFTGGARSFRGTRNNPINR